MGGNKGSNTTTQQSAPDPQAYAAYQQLLQRAQGVASTPYTPYTGEMVAPVNAQQNLGISNINQYANAAQPNLGTASSMVQNASNPLTTGQIQNYLNPYTQNVVDATQRQFANANQQQQQQVTGNAIAQGALGGNRTAVAQAELANQQNLAQAPVIAGLYDKGYQGALNTAYQQYQQNPMAAAGLLGNLGVAQQTAGISGAGAQIGAGTLQQTTQQQLDAAKMAQFQQQQAFPYQQAQWLAGLTTGVGSQMGGTGSTTTPGPNQTAQYLGLALAGAGMFLKDGGRVPSYNRGGVAGYADGGSPGVAGMPWAGAPSWIPSNSIVHGSGAPRAPAPYNPGQQDMSKQASAIGDLAKKLRSGSDTSLGYGSNVPGAIGPTSVGGAPLQDPNNNPFYGGGSAAAGDIYGGSAISPLQGLSALDYGQMHRGGVVGYADGGSPDFNDRFDAAFPNIGSPAGSDVINPDEPYRLAGPEAMNAWRTGVDTDLSHPQLDTTPSDQPRGIAPVELPEVITGKRKSQPSGTALAYSGDAPDVSSGIAPADVRAKNEYGVASSLTPDRSRPIIDFGQNPNLGSSLMSAGFGMMASRSPFLGVAVGEGGQAGMASYSAQQQREYEAEKAAQQLQLERERVERPYSEMTAAQKAADIRAKEAKIPFGWNQNDDGSITPIKNGPQDPAYMASVRDASGQPKWTPVGTVVEGNTSHPAVMNASTGEVRDAVTGKPPSDTADFEIKGKKAEISDSDAAAIAKYTVDTGDTSRLTGLGYSGSNKVKVQAAINHYKDANNISDADMANRKQAFAATGIGLNAGARTRGTREENLAIILDTTQAAAPAAIAASKEVARTGLVPLNRIIQNGRLMTSDPAQVKFGMANLQLAEGWARAMNPTGVMRDADRDKALGFMDTALSDGTYEQAVNQLVMQIQRERDAAHKGSTNIPSKGEAQPGVVPPVEPPAGAVGRRKDNTGKYWYVDKDGKPLGPIQ